MRRRYMYPFLLFVLLAGAITAVSVYTRSTSASRPMFPKPASYPFAEAEKMASNELPIWLRSMRYTNDCKDYGFQDCEETQRATLGKPYISYSFILQGLAEKVSFKGNVRDQLDGGIHIEFPVLVDGQVRSNISVIFRDNKWSVGATGGYKSIQLVNLQHYLESQGITERVDQVGFGNGLFGLLDYKGQTWLIPLFDPEKRFPELDLSGTHMYRFDEVLPLLYREGQKMKVEYEQNLQYLRDHEKPYKPGPSPIPPTLPPTWEPERVYPAPHVPTPIGSEKPAITEVPAVPQDDEKAYPAP